MTAFDGVDTYAMPYFWGTMGIAYRKDLIPREFNSCINLLQLDEHCVEKLSCSVTHANWLVWP